MSAKAQETLEKAIGRTVRERRKALGLSQEELGFQSGLHRTYIGVIERGEKTISVHNLAVVAKSLGVRASELLSRAGF